MAATTTKGMESVTAAGPAAMAPPRPSAAVGPGVTIRSQTAPPESRTVAADGAFSFEGLAPSGGVGPPGSPH